MLQGQSQIAGKKKEDRKIWFTYHALALKTTREAVALNPNLPVRSEKTDKDSACLQNSLPPCFSKSLVAIVMCVFTMEYRINGVAQREGIWKEKINSYFNEDEVKVLLCKPKEFNRLSLCQKWRNIMEVLEKTPKPEFCELVEKLKNWITIRNKIAHGDHEQIRKLQISPKQALSCYDTITETIFELNTALGYGKEDQNDRDCKKMLLGQKNISP